MQLQNNERTVVSSAKSTGDGSGKMTIAKSVCMYVYVFQVLLVIKEINVIFIYKIGVI